MSGKEPACQCRRHEGHGFDPWLGKIPWRRAWQPTPVHSNPALVASDGKDSICNAGDPGLIPGLGRSPGEGKGHPLQYSGLENPKDRRAWRATVHGAAKSWTRIWMTSNNKKDEMSSLVRWRWPGFSHPHDPLLQASEISKLRNRR